METTGLDIFRFDSCFPNQIGNSIDSLIKQIKFKPRELALGSYIIKFFIGREEFYAYYDELDSQSTIIEGAILFKLESQLPNFPRTHKLSEIITHYIKTGEKFNHACLQKIFNFEEKYQRFISEIKITLTYNPNDRLVQTERFKKFASGELRELRKNKNTKHFYETGTFYNACWPIDSFLNDY